ncbi:MAG: sigma 54-interacting transcriptional regulator [Desulfobacterales bacterium]|nr:sigma 54-interacting transcriptional regulator [Desulfobacterales bacterium]
MDQKKIHIGVFASSESIREKVATFVAREDQFDRIDILTVVLEKAIPVGKKMEKKGVEVIISRRGTAYLLRENLTIPVITFPQSTISLLLSLQKASQIGEKILVPSFRNAISDQDMIENLLNVKIIQGLYSDQNSLDRVVQKGRDEGCNVVVGGNITRECAGRHGLNFVEITNSDEEIEATFETARSAALSVRQQRATARQYFSIINTASDGIIAVDPDGEITTINNAASRLLNLKPEDVHQQPITDVFPNTPIKEVLKTKEPIIDRIQKVALEQYIFNHYPVTLDGDIIGAVSTFNRIDKVIQSENEVRRALTRGFVARYHIDDLIHQCRAMQDVVSMARQYAQTESTILLEGETGTGKEILAQSIHNLSHRAKAPCVTLNCAALPEQLLESELFGYVEGAFTGSKKGGKPGLFEIAHNGTIFLDEIDSTPESVQLRLLRVLQEREVRRVGGDRNIPVNVRVIASAGKDLGKSVHEEKFREDLYFRLNVLQIRIPAIRERREDIPLLLDYFSKKISLAYGLTTMDISQNYMERLIHYSWPGNVRQIRNFAERLVLNCHLGCSMDVLETLYSELISYLPDSKYPPVLNQNEVTDLKKELTAQKVSAEADIIRQALEDSRFNKSEAAKSLGMSRTTLWRKMKMLRID